MRVKLTDRDREIIQFLKDTKCADTESLSHIFFNSSLRACQHRLHKLVEAGYIKAYRENILSQNVFYKSKRPRSCRHALKITQFISELYKLDIEIIKSKVPYKIHNIIADALFVIKIGGEVKIIFVEADLSKYFSLSKYENLYYSRAWADIFPVFPSIVVISDKRVDTNDKFNIIKIDTEFTNIQDLILKL